MAGFNFDTDAPPAEPWDFPVTVGGVTYATREPSLPDLADLAERLRGTPTQVVAALAAFVRGAFVGDRPADAAFTTMATVAMASALFDHASGRIEVGTRPAGDPAAGGGGAKPLPN